MRVLLDDKKLSEVSVIPKNLKYVNQGKIYYKNFAKTVIKTYFNIAIHKCIIDALNKDILDYCM